MDWIRRYGAFTWAAFVLSIISVLISSYTLVLEKRIDADWATILVAILALLVTILLAWHIFNLMDFNQRIEESEKRISDDLSVRVDRISSELSAKSFFTIGIMEYENGKYDSAFSSFHISLSQSVRYGFDEIKRDSIHFLKFYEVHKIDIKKSNEDIEGVVKALLSTGDDGLMPLIKYLVSKLDNPNQVGL